MAKLTSNVTTISVKPPGVLPAWLANSTLNTWFQIQNTKLSSIQPNPLPNQGGSPQGKVTAWNSMSLDTRTSSLYQAAGGGHGDYAGNEVEVLDLSIDSPRWVQLRPPTTIVNNGEYYTSDNSPTSRHNYFGSHYNTHDERIMLFGGARFSDGGMLQTIDSFNLSTRTYSPIGTHPRLPDAYKYCEMRPMCVDPNTSDVYVFTGTNTSMVNPVVLRWIRSSNSWATPVAIAIIDRTSQPVWDTNRNIIVSIYGNTMRIYNPDTKTQSTVSITGTNVPLPNNADFQGNSTNYVPQLNSYVHFTSGSGGTLYKINADTHVATVIDTPGASSIPSNSHGSFGRMRFAPKLNGIVYAPVYDGNVWFIRLY